MEITRFPDRVRDAPGRNLRLLDQVRHVLRFRHYSPKTEKSYVGWVRRYVTFHGKRHPRELGSGAVSAFLSHLALELNVSASTQNQALNALLSIEKIEGIARAKRPVRVPVVLSRNEVNALMCELSGPSWIVASLLYGAGLRRHAPGWWYAVGNPVGLRWPRVLPPSPAAER